MSPGQRQKALLAVLAGVLVVALLPDLGSDDDAAPPGASLRERGRARGRAAAPEVTEVVGLDLAALEPRAETFEVGRNPFAFYSPPPPPPPPPEPRRPVITAPRVDPGPPPPPPPPPRPQPPSTGHLKYVGSFGPPEAQIGVVVSGEEIHNVREGDVMEGKFIVDDIGFESIALRFVGFPDTPPRRLPVGQ